MTCKCSPAARKVAATGSPTAGTGVAWVPGSRARRSACASSNLPGQFVGPLGEMAGGIDISLPVTLGLASLVYLALLSLFPESRAVFGPNDSRSKHHGVKTSNCVSPPDADPPVGASRLARRMTAAHPTLM